MEESDKINFDWFRYKTVVDVMLIRWYMTSYIKQRTI